MRDDDEPRKILHDEEEEVIEGEPLGEDLEDEEPEEDDLLDEFGEEIGEKEYE